MSLKSFSFSTDFYSNPEVRGRAQAMAEWLAESFFPDSNCNATAEVTRRSFEIPGGSPTIYVGFFSPDDLVRDPLTSDKRLYIQSPSAITSEKNLINAFRHACDIVWSNPRYFVSEAQRDGKFREIFDNWLRNDDKDQMFPVDLSHYWAPTTRPTPWTSTFPFDDSQTAFFRLGHPLVEQRLFRVFQKRGPRKYGRAATPEWIKTYETARLGKKFARQRDKLIATPNDKGFGNDGTSDWKENIRDAAKRVAVDAAKAAVSSAAKGLSDAAAKKAGSTIKKRAANALKEITRKR